MSPETYNETPAPKFTVTFDMNGMAGSAPEDIVGVPHLSTITEPGNPIVSDSNYHIRGWYKEASCINEWDFSNDKVTGNTTLYARWVTSINGHDCVKLAGKYWATEDVDECSFDADSGPDADGNAWGWYYYSQNGDGAMLAAASWGSTWRLPSRADWEALLNDENCEWIWTSSCSYKGRKVPGVVVTGKIDGEIGNSIFLPLGGLGGWNTEKHDNDVGLQGTKGYYWAYDFAVYVTIYDGNKYVTTDRDLALSNCGMLVRPISD